MSQENADLRKMYLDLLRDIIINEIYEDPSLSQKPPSKLKRLISGAEHAAKAYDPALRQKGRDWPSMAHSMIGLKRIENLRQACCDVIERKVPGDFIETGVWRGGACIMMRGVLKAYGDSERRVWVADSFEGLPKPNADAYPADRKDKHFSKLQVLAVSQEQVASNFQKYGLLDGQVQFLKGWFRDTLPKADIDRLAVLRLDGDMYESTLDGLTNLYHKVSPGGYVIVDDYHAVKACRTAVHDFLNDSFPKEAVEIEEIDGTGVFWRRQG